MEGGSGKYVYVDLSAFSEITRMGGKTSARPDLRDKVLNRTYVCFRYLLREFDQKGRFRVRTMGFEILADPRRRLLPN